MARKIGIGIIGCGEMAKAHLQGVNTLKEEGSDLFNIKAVCDIEKERAKSFSQKVLNSFGNQPSIYTDVVEFLKRQDIEAVSICTTHVTHHSIAKEAIERGKHIMIEKPLAIVLSQGRELVGLIGKNRTVFMVAENYRMTPQNRAIKKVLEEKLIGEPYFFLRQWAFEGDTIWCGTPWRHRRSESGGGCMFDMGVHDSDLMQYWFGEVNEIYGITKTYIPVRGDESGRVGATNEDFGVGVISFKNGVIGSWMGSSAANKGFNHLEIVGSKGTYYRKKGVELKNGETMSNEELIKKYVPAVREDSVATEYEDFYQAIVYKRKPEIDALMGLKAMTLPYALYESRELEKPVKFNDVLEGKIANFEKKVIMTMME